MNSLKKIIIILIILIIAIIIALLFVRKEKAEEITQDVNTTEKPRQVDSNVKKLTSKDLFYLVEDCSNNYIKYIAQNDNKAVYNILDKEFILQYNISEQNVLEQLEQYTTNNFIRLKNAYVMENDFDLRTFLLEGYLLNKETKDVSIIQLIVRIDFKNNAFSVLPYIYMRNNNITNLYEGMNIKDFTNSISYNQYNQCQYIQMTEIKNCSKLMEDYINLMLYYPDMAYNMLDETYRNLRFGSLESFKKFLEENKNRAKYLNKYKVNYYDTYTEYVSIDYYENYYIFKETDIGNYTVILDTYTIDIPEFTEKYTTAKEQEKVALNIQKIFQALNSKDYRYVYSKLADSFKNNYFKTQQDFENYIKNKVFEYNDVEYVQYNKSGNLNQYKLKLTDKTESNFDENGIEKTSKRYVDFSIVMQLGEGTEFTMSFEI